MRLLFVCVGNTCRSPMAAALAKRELKGLAEVESAGIMVKSIGTAGPAIEVMRSEFGIDISGHVPRSISEVTLGKFDYIIALDSYVGDYLRRIYEVPEEKLIVWQIEDPYLEGIEVYKRCAYEIYSYLQDFKQAISGGHYLKQACG